MIGSSSDDEDYCIAALEAANKWVRVNKGLVGNFTEGAENFCKGAGKELNKLFDN
jgi:hypothetical protein